MYVGIIIILFRLATPLCQRVNSSDLARIQFKFRLSFSIIFTDRLMKLFRFVDIWTQWDSPQGQPCTADCPQGQPCTADSPQGQPCTGNRLPFHMSIMVLPDKPTFRPTNRYRLVAGLATGLSSLRNKLESVLFAVNCSFLSIQMVYSSP